MKTLRFSSLILALTAGALVATATSESVDDALIRRHRMGTLVVAAPAGATVRVEQLRHEFWFGTALANQAFDGRMDAADAARYREVVLANFNSAVTENALKWLAMEPERGDIHYGTVDAILDWTEAHELPLRGHNVYWGTKEWVLPWHKELDDATLRTTLRDRALDIATRYRGRFHEYDLNNEMVHSNYYAERFGPGITAQMAAWFHQGDPAASLWLNDYDMLTGRRLDDYLAMIRDLQAQGVRLGGIGVQGHLHGTGFDPAELRDALDRLSVFGLPIRVTEFNIPGQRSPFYEDRERAQTPAEEAAQARHLEDYLRICFAHPAVDGVLLWGFWEGANWIPASSLYRRDWSIKPAGEAYRRLVFQKWWTDETVTADADGRVAVPAFYGRHRVTVDGRSIEVDLRQADGMAFVDLR